MPITMKSLEEPLLTRQQAAVCRNIACAAQLNEASKSLFYLKTLLEPNVSQTKCSNEHFSGHRSALEKIPKIQQFLEAEITKLLMQIRLPATPLTKDSEVKPPVALR